MAHGHCIHNAHEHTDNKYITAYSQTEKGLITFVGL
jgi:hypothetical protein